MKNKLFLFSIILILLFLVIFTSLHVNALSEKETYNCYRERFINCDNCESNKNYQMHYQNNQCSHRKYNCGKKNCNIK